MTDYEALILQRQEELEIWEDAPEMFPEDDIIEEQYSDFIFKVYEEKERLKNGL